MRRERAGPDGPIAADMQTLFPARLRRGAAPLRMHNGMTVIAEAEIRGHWQAEIMRAQTDRADNVTKFFSWPLSIDSWPLRAIARMRHGDPQL